MRNSDLVSDGFLALTRSCAQACWPSRSLRSDATPHDTKERLLSCSLFTIPAVSVDGLGSLAGIRLSKRGYQ